MADAAPACAQCGSTRIRHARSRTFAQRWIRGLTEWERYACGECGHRGWRKGKLPRLKRSDQPRALAAPGRRSERRDARLRRRRQLRIAATVALGLALGYVVARFVLRMASMQPPPPE
jgi:DNA-directed RNA polymerase subunit RPC12/RpoP